MVYLCPTRQLVNQVVEQAHEKYGLTVLGFTGSANQYDPTSKAEYRNADRIAVTTYSSLFNTNPFFKDADIIIVDDAHAAESYIALLWSLRINRREHQVLHAAISNVLKPLLSATNYARLIGEWEGPIDRDWVDKIPTPEFININHEITAVLDIHAPSTDLKYSWQMIREHLSACQLYLSSHEILIRPLIPPTWTHAAFQQPKQRIFMSATLGTGGDLERLMGRKNIFRLSIQSGWDKQGVGRRFFIFPSMSLKDDEIIELRRKLMSSTDRSVVLVPNDPVCEEISKDITENLGFITYLATDIEESKKIFVNKKNVAAIISNRYDGIDFPGDECRLLFIDGLPRAMNLQERFLMSRMGANILFNERIQTRVLQAIGRCTRSLEDFSAVVVAGEELPDYLADIKRRKFFHPELQAEIEFGVNQSKNTTLEDIVENFELFLENGEQWEEVNQQIVASRKNLNRENFPAMNDLETSANHEIDFQNRLWRGDYELALEFAERILGSLVSAELRGYRALWHYLAGSAATLGGLKLAPKARAHFNKAKEAAKDLPWLVSLARYQDEDKGQENNNNTILMEQIEQSGAVLSRFGITHDYAFSKREKEILDGLESNTTFEHAQKLLGELLGFNTGKIETDGSPDPWWIVGNLCFVFEDHAGAQQESSLDVKKARQVSSHPQWMRVNVEASKNSQILPVLITPVTKAKEGAIPYLNEVALWPLDDFKTWAKNALATLRNLRGKLHEPGDLLWRAEAAEAFSQNELDASRLFIKLKGKPAAKNLMSTN
ncbi:MAG: Helicase C-terminal domain-containing protein [Candidatus Nitrotoga sp. SPKER]|nr:MAG: Helicase C-terminal domain-containing protein [Candidatus Nitrotoga sp. SPKER]